MAQNHQESTSLSKQVLKAMLEILRRLSGRSLRVKDTRCSPSVVELGVLEITSYGNFCIYKR